MLRSLCGMREVCMGYTTDKNVFFAHFFFVYPILKSFVLMHVSSSRHLTRKMSIKNLPTSPL